MPVSGSTSTSQNWAAKPGAWPPSLTAAAAMIGPPVAARLRGDRFERHRLEIADIAAGGLRAAVLPDHAVGIDLPDLGGTLAQFVDDLVAGVDHRHAGCEGDARAAGGLRVADRSGVGDDRAHAVVVDAERLGRHHRHRGARAADVGAAGGDHTVPSSLT